MDEKNEKLDRLHAKLDMLVKRQESFARDLAAIREEIDAAEQEGLSVRKAETTETNPVIVGASTEVPMEKTDISYQEFKAGVVESRDATAPQPTLFDRLKRDGNLEKFIGENLISKIGIVITVIGVAIGARYSIQHELISPLTRIILGYLAGGIMLFTGMRLKTNYRNFSAVLVSGSIATMYFMTFMAYNMYALIPQPLAFGMMVVFTIFTVFAALKYDEAVIAHFGLVGAYAIPFLLSDGSGNVEILFSYIAIINAGILYLAFHKYWKSLNYAAFILTWLIFSGWDIFTFNREESFAVSLIFSSIYFITFYITFLAYKLIRKEEFRRLDIMMIMSNALIYFGLGYRQVDSLQNGEELLGLFTLGHALIHFLVSLIIRRSSSFDWNMFHTIIGLVLIYITLAIPVQLEGSWVTVMWAGESVVLFSISRRKKVAFYEGLAYISMTLSFLSFCHDWVMDDYLDTPIWNVSFLSNLLFTVAFGFIYYLSRQSSQVISNRYVNFGDVCKMIIPGIALFGVYITFLIEIERYWDIRYNESIRELVEYSGISFDEDLRRFKAIWILNYSMVFTGILSILAIYKIKNARFSSVCFSLQSLALILFLIGGLNFLYGLGQNYFEQPYDGIYTYGWMNIGIRYISYLIVAGLLYLSYLFFKMEMITIDRKLFDFELHGTAIIIGTAEIYFLTKTVWSEDIMHVSLSIFWGLYALMLIILGIRSKQKHLRISAIAIFACTLIKVFIYDAVKLDTISKTIMFVALGVLLLLISFLYNKFKSYIADE